MRAKLCFLMSAVCSVIAGGMAVAQQDYKCFSTPVPACYTQCGCPTSTTQDFCESAMPIPGSSEVTLYYCMPWSGQSCTANGLNCGGSVFLCLKCDCAKGV